MLAATGESPPDMRERPAGNGPSTSNTFDTLSLPAAADDACRAYVILVETAEGRQRRRLFYSLHSATRAVRRAQAKGLVARMVLCEVTPV